MPRVGLAAWLLLSSLPSRIQNELLAVIELGLDSLEARAQPLGIDLAADELRARMSHLQPQVLPSYNAAVHLSSWPWAMSEQSTVVVPRRGSPSASASAAIPVWQARATTAAALGSEARATRFAAWSLAHGLVVTVGTAAALERLRRALGETLTTVSSPPALLVDLRVQAVDRSLVPWKRLAELEERSSMLSAQIDRAKLARRFPLEAQLLDGLRAEPPRAPALPWLDLGEGELFIAPKLGALARRTELWAVLQAAARHAGLSVAPVAGR